MHQFGKQVLIIFALTFTAKAIAASEQLNDVYAKEATVNQLFASLYSYENARDYVFGKNGGCFDELASFDTDIQNWLHGYDAVNSFANISDLDQIDTEAVKILRQQSVVRIRLEIKALNLKEKLQHATLLLKSDSKIPSQQDLQNYIQEIGDKRLVLKGYLQTLTEKIDRQMVSISELSRAFTVDFFTAKYKAAAIAAGTEEAIRKYNEFDESVRGEILGAPIVAEIENMEMSLSTMMINLEGMRLKEAMVLFEGTCTKHLDYVANSKLSSDQMTRIMGEIKTICTKAREAYDNGILVYSPVAIARAMHKQKLRKYRSLCLGGMTDQKRRCDVYGWLQAIDEKAILAFSDRQIFELEQSWALVEGR